MAYVNLVSQAYASKAEFFCRLRDFICKRNGTYDHSTDGIGWTLFDSSYVVDEDNPALNDWFVIYSAGESGDDDIYIKCTWISGYLRFEGYQSWNPSTNAGSSNVYNSGQNSMTVDETDATRMWIYGDLDFIFAVNFKTSSDYRTGCFGKIDPGYVDVYGTVATCSSALSSGSNVSITVDAVPSNWAIGKQVFIRTTHTDAVATVKAEKITIKTLSGNTITADLANSYTANSKLSDFVGYVSCSNISFGYSVSAFITGSGTFNISMTSSVTGLYTPTEDPNPYESRIGLFDVLMYSTSVGIVGVLPNVKTTAAHNTEFDAEDVLTEDDGTEWRCFHAYSSKYILCTEV